jgi:hypothetical protein
MKDRFANIKALAAGMAGEFAARAIVERAEQQALRQELGNVLRCKFRGIKLNAFMDTLLHGYPSRAMIYVQKLVAQFLLPRPIFCECVQRLFGAASLSAL